MFNSPLRFGVVGFGAWGRHHAAAITKTNDAELVAIADSCEQARTDAHAMHPDVPIMADFRDLVVRDHVDVVDIVAPNHLHHSVAMAALDAGKHLLLEKPMCLSLDECNAVLRRAQEANRQVALVHQFRLSSLWGRVKELIDDGVIGVPQYALIELSRNPYRRGCDGWRFDVERVGDWILEEPIHFFDLARWYLQSAGNPVSVYAVANSRQPGHPELQDNCSAILHFANGSYAVVSQTLAAFEHHQTAKLAGTKGAIWATWSGAMDRTEQPTFSLKVFDGARLKELPIARTPGELFELEDQIKMLVDAFRHGKPPSCDAEDGRWAVHLCLAAQQSVDSQSIVQIIDP